MSSSIRLDKAIESMRYDIVLTNRIFSNNIPENIHDWLYYISIYAHDEVSLFNALKLLKSLNILTRSIIIIPKTYMSCKFDCFTIVDIFKDIHSSSDYNIDTISIIEEDELEDGDFYLTITRKNKLTELMDIMAYRDLESYYN